MANVTRGSRFAFLPPAPRVYIALRRRHAMMIRSERLLFGTDGADGDDGVEQDFAVTHDEGIGALH